MQSLDINQLMHLQQFFQIKDEQGTAAAVEWAEGVIAHANAQLPPSAHDTELPATTETKKPHLTVVE